VRAHWLLHGSVAEGVAVGILLVLAAAIFLLTATL